MAALIQSQKQIIFTGMMLFSYFGNFNLCFKSSTKIVKLANNIMQLQAINFENYS